MNEKQYQTTGLSLIVSVLAIVIATGAMCAMPPKQGLWVAEPLIDMLVWSPVARLIEKLVLFLAQPFTCFCCGLIALAVVLLSERSKASLCGRQTVQVITVSALLLYATVTPLGLMMPIFLMVSQPRHAPRSSPAGVLLESFSFWNCVLAVLIAYLCLSVGLRHTFVVGKHKMSEKQYQTTGLSVIVSALAIVIATGAMCAMLFIGGIGSFDGPWRVHPLIATLVLLLGHPVTCFGCGLIALAVIRLSERSKASLRGRRTVQVITVSALLVYATVTTLGRVMPMAVLG